MPFYRGRYFSGHDYDVSSSTTKKEKVDGKEVLLARTDLNPKSIACHIANPLLVALNTCEIKRRCYHCYALKEDPLELPDNRFNEGKFGRLVACEECEMVYFCSEVKG